MVDYSLGLLYVQDHVIKAGDIGWLFMSHKYIVTCISLGQVTH